MESIVSKMDKLTLELLASGELVADMETGIVRFRGKPGKMGRLDWRYPMRGSYVNIKIPKRINILAHRVICLWRMGYPPRHATK